MTFPFSFFRRAQRRPCLELDDVLAARGRLAHGLRVTPCHGAPALSEVTGRRIWLKRDDLQRTGSFKERGARHALLCLGAEQKVRGVVAASAGNHALGLAYHAAQLGVHVTVVMPITAPEVKIARCRSLGATVVLQGRSFDEANSHAETLADASGAAYIHPFDDPRVMAGQGTLALEILEQAPQLDTLVVPVGGGGLLAGVVTVVKALRPDVRIVAVEPENAASFRSAMRQGAPVFEQPGRTLADGLAVARVGGVAFDLAAGRVDDVVTVTEHELGAAMALLARRCGAVVEGAGAAAVAAVMAGKVHGRALVLPIGGRNVDLCTHRRVLAEHDEVAAPEIAQAA
jgi:threonine dehydratase